MKFGRMCCGADGRSKSSHVLLHVFTLLWQSAGPQRLILVLNWYHIFRYHPDIYIRDSPYFDTYEVSIMTIYLFSIPFKSIYHARIFISRQNRPNTEMVYIGVVNKA